VKGLVLDTSFVSAFAPDRPALPADFQKWVAEQRTRGTWFLSAIVVAELQRGVAKLGRTGAGAKAGRLAGWLETTLVQFDSRILPIDAPTAREAGELADRAAGRGRDPGLADVLIAATARLNDFGVLTANTRHFAVLEVPHFNPLAGEYPPG
jgi:predicted nucleic acid-binding protein